MNKEKSDDPLLQSTAYGFMIFTSASLQNLTKFHLLLKSHQLSPQAIFELANECVPALRQVGKKLQHEDGAESAASAIEKALQSHPDNSTQRAREVCDTCVNLYTRVYSNESQSLGFIHIEVNRLLRNVKSVVECSITALTQTVREACKELAAYVLLMWEGLKIMFPAMPPSMTSQTVPLYRGLRLSLSAFKALCDQVDRFVVMPGFTSFSLDSAIALQFPGLGPPDLKKEVDILLELDSFCRPAIQDMAATGLKHEREVVMHPFSTFKVVASSKFGPENRPVIHLRDVEIVLLREQTISSAGETAKAEAKEVRKCFKCNCTLFPDYDFCDSCRLFLCKGCKKLPCASHKLKFTVLREISRIPSKTPLKYK